MVSCLLLPFLTSNAHRRILLCTPVGRIKKWWYICVYISNIHVLFLSLLPCAVLKNIGPGGLKTAMSLLFSVNLLFTYAIMLAPPREYLERWIFKRPRVRRRVSSKALFSHNPISSGGGNGNATTGTTNSTTDAGIQQQGGEVKVPWWSERRSRRWRKNLFRAMLVLFTFGTWPGHKRGEVLGMFERDASTASENKKECSSDLLCHSGH